MQQLCIKQHVFSIGEQFTVTDMQGRTRYTVQGSFLELPKSFRITDEYGREVAVIVKKLFSMMPHFSVQMHGMEVASIDKELTFLTPKYRIDAQGLHIEGDWWNMNFTVTRQGQQVASITQRWFAWGDTYEVTVFEDRLVSLIVALVVAIDCVKSNNAPGPTPGNT